MMPKKVLIIFLAGTIAAIVSYMLSTGAAMMIEFDQIAHFPAPVSHDTKTIEDIFATALEMGVIRRGETITVNPATTDPNDIGDLGLLDIQFCERLIQERLNTATPQYQYREACLSAASLDNILVNSEDHRPLGGWYAHGLSAPCCEGAVQNYSCSFQGLVWLQEQGGKQVRERFLVMACELYFETSDGRLQVSAHELGHVLNLHHCEYEGGLFVLDDSLDVLEDPRTHLREHPENEIKPGPTGAGWCDLSSAHSSDMHPSTASCCGDPAFDSSENLPAGVTLEVRPEKLAYLPGEPVRLRVLLRIPAGGEVTVERLGPGGLHPYLGYLRVWTPDGDGEVRTFFPPMVATRSLKWEGGYGPVEESEVVDLSFMHPRPGRAVQVGGTYAGLRLAGQDAAPLRVASAISVIQPVAPGAPAGAMDPFGNEEARLFLFLLGGDHLTTGIAVMQEVAHAAGPLAPYADLALGVNLAVPFHRYDRATGTIVVRHPRFEEARQHLDRAQAGRAIFPFSYAIVLDQALARTYEGLGDALRETNPASSLELYEIAEQHYEAVATLTSASFETDSGAGHAPLSPTEKTAVTLSGARRTSLQGKIEVLRRGGEE